MASTQLAANAMARAIRASEPDIEILPRGVSELASAQLEANEIARHIRARKRLLFLQIGSSDELHWSETEVPRIEVANDYDTNESDLPKTIDVLSKIRLVANTMILLGALGVVGGSIWLGSSLGTDDATGFIRAITIQFLAILFGLLGYTLARSVRRVKRGEAQGERQWDGEKFFYAATQ